MKERIIPTAIGGLLAILFVAAIAWWGAVHGNGYEDPACYHNIAGQLPCHFDNHGNIVPDHTVAPAPATNTHDGDQLPGDK
jgi:hypothetical protein